VRSNEVDFSVEWNGLIVKRERERDLVLGEVIIFIAYFHWEEDLHGVNFISLL
jgi:hypothetical protein